MERRAFLLGMLGALTAAAGFAATTTTASAGAQAPLATCGATDANDVKAEDFADLRTDYAQYYRRRGRRVYRRYYRRPARRYYRRARRRYYY
jgi:hypothetical protein